MGVPKFFRWISERYPNISVSVENNQIPTFDCLYLDMNGIIHICSHPDDENVQFRITEDQIFKNVFKYIDFLFKTVKPREVFFLAVDGVAPRAKMNQQRGRRFKSVKEAKDRELTAIRKGVILPLEKRFDSNAITPGTEFMDRLQHALSTFLVEKIKSDCLWQGIDVILSGHETPGEGEHKIQEYIRYKRSLPDYNPNTRHCLYGLDADLMFLGLACHEPYFALLREEVTFTAKNKSRRAYIAEETKFFLLHLSVLRGYIDMEFSSLKPILGNDYDLEKIIDDWIILSFLVGNDFVPHLPNLHIHTSALPLLWKTYIKVRPLMTGYMNDNGQLNIANLLSYIGDLSNFDYKNFEDIFEDMKWMFEKNGEKIDVDEKMIETKMLEKNLIDFESDCVDDGTDEVNPDELNIVEDVDRDALWKKQFTAYKREYYSSKLGLQLSSEVLAQQALEYFTALQWISYYYFSGVPSWSWFYSQHYAPFISDLLFLDEEVKNNGIKFEIGKPFLPFEQLMAVLPSDSSELLPDCFNILMTMESSPILDFYPKSFQTDLNGKKRDWESVVLIPFIDETRLLISLERHKELLSEEEDRRNVHSAHIKFRFTQKQLFIIEIDPTVFRVSRDSLVFGLYPGVQRDLICQGFPTFEHVKYSVLLEKAFIRVFENHSAFESIVLKIRPSVDTLDAESVARGVLNQLVYVNWPTFILTKVVAVLDKENRVTLDPENMELVTTPLDDLELKKVKEFVSCQPHEFYKRRGILLDLSNMIILESLHSDGNFYEIVNCHKAGCNVKIERQWTNNKRHWYLHQLSVSYDSIESLQRDDSRVCTKLSQLFSLDSIAFCLDSNYYGLSGNIQSINNNKRSIILKLNPTKEPQYSNCPIVELGDNYMSVEELSQYLSIDSFTVSKITGSIFITKTRISEPKLKSQLFGKDRHSIGLDLKNNKFNLQVPGWVIKTRDDNGLTKWMYSMKVVDTLKDYRDKFPMVFLFINQPNFESRSLEDMFDIEDDVELLEARYAELRRYLDSLEYRNVERLSNDCVLLTSAQISRLESFTDHFYEQLTNTQVESPLLVELKFEDLYRPHISLQGSKPDMSTEYRLLDRVVCSCDYYTVPIGLRGVVIGIEPLAHGESKLEILFDKRFDSAITIRGSTARCYRMPPHSLINTTHGARKYPAKIPLSNLTVPSIISDKNTPYQRDSIIDNLQNSDLLAALFSTLAPNLPPMTSLKYSDNLSSKNGVISDRGNPIPVNSHHETDVPRTFTTVITGANCPHQYATLFHLCTQCGVIDPTIIERHLNSDIFMSFRCDQMVVAECKETDLAEGRVRHAARVWHQLHRLQQQPAALGPTLTSSPPPHRPPSRDTLLASPPLHDPVDTFVLGTLRNGHSLHKPFIRAPKSKIMFP